MGSREHKICQYNFEYCDLGCKLLSGTCLLIKLILGKRGFQISAGDVDPALYIHTRFFSPLCCTGCGFLKANLLFASSALIFHTWCWLLNYKLSVYSLTNTFLSAEPKQVLHCAYPSWDPLRVTCSLCRKPFLPAAATAAVTGILFPSTSAVTLAVEAAWETSLLLCVFLKAVW